MGRLINQERRAEAKRAGQRRKQVIMEAAERAFCQRPYTQVTLEELGKQAGVPKGTSSLYFTTKEELLGSLLVAEVDTWCDAIRAGLSKATTSLDARALATALAKSLAGRDKLTRYLALLHVALEESLDTVALDRLKGSLRVKLTGLAEQLESCSDSLQAGDGARLLRRLWMAVAGLEPLARPRGAVLLALHEPGLHWLKVDFEDELRALLEAFLTDRT